MTTVSPYDSQHQRPSREEARYFWSISMLANVFGFNDNDPADQRDLNRAIEIAAVHIRAECAKLDDYIAHETVAAGAEREYRATRLPWDPGGSNVVMSMFNGYLAILLSARNGDDARRDLFLRSLDESDRFYVSVARPLPRRTLESGRCRDCGRSRPFVFLWGANRCAHCFEEKLAVAQVSDNKRQLTSSASSSSSSVVDSHDWLPFTQWHFLAQEVVSAIGVLTTGSKEISPIPLANVRLSDVAEHLATTERNVRWRLAKVTCPAGAHMKFRQAKKYAQDYLLP